MCMNKDSEQFILMPFVQGFNSFNNSSVESNLCLLFNMCAAYAEVGLLFFM